MFLFIPRLNVIDFIDIFLVAILIYELYMLIRGSAAINIFLGLLSVYLLWYIVKALEMKLLSTILGQFIGVGIIVLLIVFQQELRRFLLLIGTRGFFKQTFSFPKLFSLSSNKSESPQLDINKIISACKNMSKSKTGALIIISDRSELQYYISTGDRINAEVSSHLLESIFFKNSPLHDGAVIIQNNTIKAARCILPVANNDDFPSQLGFRHRAAVGITQQTDAIAVIVSEETGNISIARKGKLTDNITFEYLETILKRKFYKLKN